MIVAAASVVAVSVAVGLYFVVLQKLFGIAVAVVAAVVVVGEKAAVAVVAVNWSLLLWSMVSYPLLDYFLQKAML